MLVLMQFVKKMFLLSLVEPVPISLEVNPSTIGTPSAGSTYSISCAAIDDVNGLSTVPQIEWLGPDGSTVESGGGITVGEQVNEDTTVTSTLTFDSIRTSHRGEYTCQATLNSPALTLPFITTLVQTVNVTGKHMYSYIQ